MKIIKILGLIILSLIGLILCFILVIKVLGYRTNIANGITSAEIKQIEIGMPFEETISILGKPFKIYTRGGQHSIAHCKNPKFLEMSVDTNIDIIQVVDSFFNGTYCCDSWKESIQKGVTLEYTRRPCFLRNLFSKFPMLWVHLDSNYCVQEVYARELDLDLKPVIYSLYRKVDYDTWKEVPNEISLYINEELLEKYFTSRLTTKTLDNGKQIDKRLVGIWQGSEKDQQVLGIEKRWEMDRKEDGTFTTNFEFILDGETFSSIENGNWWVEGNVFFEHHENSGKIDSYKFIVLNKEQIKFKMLTTDFDFAVSNYSFIDTKVKKDSVERK